MYKTIKDKQGKYVTVEYGFDLQIGDFATVYNTFIPILFENVSLQRLEHLGVDISNLEIVEVILVEL